MSMINSVGNVLTNKKISNLAEGATKSVLIMTGIKAVARPAFIYADPKSDAETKKYTATKEFLYQALCLGITFALLPMFSKGGFKLAQKYIPEGSKVAEMIKTAKSSKDGVLTSFKNQTKPILKQFKDASKIAKDESIKDEAAKNLAKSTVEDLAPVIEDIHKANGGKEVGSLVGSVFGLTLLAPMISHEVLHPIMKAIGMDKKSEENGKPVEPFLADAKVATEKKVDAKA